jgi:hypothetical protein
MKPKNMIKVAIERPHRNLARAAVSSRNAGFDRILLVCSCDNGSMFSSR